jgi:hypothetical protein
MPDLDLIKQAEQGMHALGSVSPAISSGPPTTTTIAGVLLLIRGRSSERLGGGSLSGCSLRKPCRGGCAFASRF